MKLINLSYILEEPSNTLVLEVWNTKVLFCDRLNELNIGVPYRDHDINWRPVSTLWYVFVYLFTRISSKLYQSLRSFSSIKVRILSFLLGILTMWTFLQLGFTKYFLFALKLLSYVHILRRTRRLFLAKKTKRKKQSIMMVPPNNFYNRPF